MTPLRLSEFDLVQPMSSGDRASIIPASAALCKTGALGPSGVNAGSTGIFSQLGGFALPVLILGFQILGWLTSGTWPEIPLREMAFLLLDGAPLWSWVIEPHSWNGLHSVAPFLLDLPLALWVFILALVITRFLQDISEKPN
jgi:hypothetical protein